MLYFSISHMCYNKDYLVLMLTSVSSVIRCTLNLFPEVINKTDCDVMQYTKSNMIYNVGHFLLSFVFCYSDLLNSNVVMLFS